MEKKEVTCSGWWIRGSGKLGAGRLGRLVSGAEGDTACRLLNDG